MLRRYPVGIVDLIILHYHEEIIMLRRYPVGIVDTSNARSVLEEVDCCEDTQWELLTFRRLHPLTPSV